MSDQKASIVVSGVQNRTRHPSEVGICELDGPWEAYWWDFIRCTHSTHALTLTGQ